jgi:hypothetical protein
VGTAIRRPYPPPIFPTIGNSRQMRFYWLILGSLAVWRVSHLLYAEDGPGNLLVRLRKRLDDGMLGQLADCFYCLSLWIAIPFACFIGQSWGERILLWPALSGAAALMQRATSPEEPVPRAIYLEDKETSDVLRTESDGYPSRPSALGEGGSNPGAPDQTT